MEKLRQAWQQVANTGFEPQLALPLLLEPFVQQRQRQLPGDRAVRQVLVAQGAWRRRVLLSVRRQIAPTHWAVGFTAALAVAASLVGLASLFVSG